MSPGEAIDTLMAAAIARRVFPGAAVFVAQAGRVLHNAAYGATTYEPETARPVTTDTIYDLASLTKMFTATAALRLLDSGALDLDAPAARYVPELRAPGVLVRHLLTHTSGLDVRLSPLRALGRDGLLAAAFAAGLKHPPGTSVAYTNINSLLLGEIVARLAGAPLDAAIRALVTEPLGLRDTGFRPDAALLPRIAPTEWDDEWRGGLVHGTVHDESAHALGGVAGHAGMFGTAAEVGAFCLAWLGAIADRQAPCFARRARAISPLQDPILRPETARRAVANQTPGLSVACGLGWMLDRPYFMGGAPTSSFGHTGFTGTAMVAVPARELVVVVLSNRVYPRRGLPEHHAVTAAVVEAALTAG